MKKIYSILLIIFLISCSSDNNTDNEIIQEPIVNSISTNTAYAGDIITILGQNFDPSENYIIEFNGIIGNISEITSTTIDVQIPNEATSGDIVFIYNDVRTTIANITINIKKLYGYKYFGAPSGNSTGQKQIVEINSSNGTSQAVVNLNVNSTYFDNLVFDNLNNKIIGLYDIDDRNVSQSLLIVDLNNNNSETISLNNVSEGSRYSGIIIE